MHFAKLSTVSVNEGKKCLVKSGKDINGISGVRGTGTLVHSFGSTNLSM